MSNKEIDYVSQIKEQYKLQYTEYMQGLENNEFKNKVIYKLLEIIRVYEPDYTILEGQDNEIGVYKLFIKAMVSLLNDSEVNLLLTDVLENNLDYDTFYAPFKEEIYRDSEKIKISNKNKITKYKIDINQIDDNDIRIKNHMYFYLEYLTITHFDNYIGSINLSRDIVNINNRYKININPSEKKVLFQDTKNHNLTINFFSYFNFNIKEIIQTNSFDQLYYDNYKMITSFINNKKLHHIKYFLFISLFVIFNQLSTNYDFYLHNTEYPLGHRTDVDGANGILKNNLFYGSIMPYGKINILFTYITSYVKEISVENVYRTLIKSIQAFQSCRDEIPLIKIYKYLFLGEDDIDNNNIKKKFKPIDPENRLSPSKSELDELLSKFKDKINYFFEYVNQRYCRTNYLSKGSELYNIQVINVGPYFNLMNYPYLYYFKNFKSINNKINKNKISKRAKNMFYILEHLIKVDSMKQEICKIILSILYCSEMLQYIGGNNTQNIDILNIFYYFYDNYIDIFRNEFISKNIKTNGRNTNHSNIASFRICRDNNRILEKINNIIKKEYNFLECCLFYYQFNQYSNIRKNIPDILNRNNENELKTLITRINTNTNKNHINININILKKIKSEIIFSIDNLENHIEQIKLFKRRNNVNTNINNNINNSGVGKVVVSSNRRERINNKKKELKNIITVEEMIQPNFVKKQRTKIRNMFSTPIFR